jgi:glycosyltransferase involved in cell wall biosynthesis
MEVSVFVTTYNHEKYIAQTLESILIQETDFDYDIIVLEDCSTDGTREILRAYQTKYPAKIRLRLAERNQRSNKAFAEEFLASSSLYIAMLDGDDYWTSPSKLQKQVEFLEAHPECALCFHNALRIYEDENRAPHPCNSSDQKRISVLEDLWKYNFIAGCTAMLRKGVLREFPEWFYTLRYGDWPLYILCAQHGKIGYIDEILGVYRIHSSGSWSSLDSLQKLEGLITFYQTMNANLDFRFNSIIEPLVSARREELAAARSLVKIAQRILPPGAIVIVMSKVYEDLPLLVGQKVWAFPDRSGRQMQQHFASGSDGSAEATWIGARSMYEFRLYGGPAQDKLLASVTVTQDTSALCWPLLNREPGEDRPFIEASPNPVPAGSKNGRTTITWSTGDGSKGVIHVTEKSLQAHYPPNGCEAIARLERLRTKGGEFLLAPRNAFTFFERYPDLKEYLDHHYRVVEDGEICRIYDLRETPPENQLDSAGIRKSQAAIS